MQYVQRWHCLCSQVSEQSSHTNIRKDQLVIVDSASNVAVFQEDNLMMW